MRCQPNQSFINFLNFKAFSAFLCLKVNHNIKRYIHIRSNIHACVIFSLWYLVFVLPESCNCYLHTNLTAPLSKAQKESRCFKVFVFVKFPHIFLPKSNFQHSVRVIRLSTKTLNLKYKPTSNKLLYCSTLSS